MKWNKKRVLLWLAGLGLPAGLVALFFLLRGNQGAMDAWVFGVVGPLEQLLGRIWSLFPFSVAEMLTAAGLLAAAVWVVRLGVLAVGERSWKNALRRLLALGAAILWLWAGFDWLWNAAYSASTFARRAGLSTGGVTAQELAQVTAHFAQRAGELCTQVERDGEGHFAVSRRGCLERGKQVYTGLAEHFPFLDIPSVQAKPLVCSRLQSILGFTGVYFPFTGEANVNVDFPACLLPATIAHEMAHQRMVSAEEEANFLGIAACVTCEDTIFRYSGYLMGLINLSNALYTVDREAWYEIRSGFPAQLVTDWTDNSAYWAQLASPAEEAAEKVYDSFLKGNGQAMGVRSYGACVDLLVAWAENIP